MSRASSSIILWIAITGQISGYLLKSWNYSTILGSYLFLQVGLTEFSAKAVDFSIAFGLFSLLLLTPRPRLPFIVTMTSLLFLGSAVLAVPYKGGFLPGVTPFAHALRWVCPFALLLQPATPGLRSNTLLIKLLLWSCGITFAAHGIEALLINPEFLDYLYHTPETYIGWQISPKEGEAILYCIGIIDIAVAIGLLTGFRRSCLAYMTIWGFVTALERVFYSPSFGWDEMLLRTSHWVIPAILWWLLGAEAKHPSELCKSLEIVNRRTTQDHLHQHAPPRENHP